MNSHDWVEGTLPTVFAKGYYKHANRQEVRRALPALWT